MDQIANPAPGFQRNPDKIITVEPYAGTVTVSETWSSLQQRRPRC